MTDIQFLPQPGGHRLAYSYSPGPGPNSEKQPGVIFLGGFKSDMSGSKALYLEDWCRSNSLSFLRFDYLGHGLSSGRFQDGTIGRWLDDALAILETTQDPQILVGSSMGGWIGLLLTLVRPKRIAGLVTIAAAADFTETLIWQKLSSDEQQCLRRDGVWQRPSEYSADPYPISFQLIEEGRQHLLLQQEQIAISCPVRLLHGMQDADVPWQTSAEIASRLSSDNVRVVLIKDGEHRLSRPQDLELITATIQALRSQLKH